METEYDLGESPTRGEWSAHFRVERYMDAETVAGWLDYTGKGATQDEFDALVCRFGEVAHNGDGYDELLYAVYDDVVGRQ